MQAAAAMTPALKFVAKPEFRDAFARALKPRKPLIFRQLFDTAGSSTYTYLLADGPGRGRQRDRVSFFLLSSQQRTKKKKGKKI